MMPFVGAASVGIISMSNATLQLNSDPKLRGRVMALFSMALLGIDPDRWADRRLDRRERQPPRVLADRWDRRARRRGVRLGDDSAARRSSPPEAVSVEQVARSRSPPPDARVPPRCLGPRRDSSTVVRAWSSGRCRCRSSAVRVERARRAEEAGWDGHHLHRLAEPVPGSVRRVRHRRRRHRADPARHRRHQRPHAAPGGARHRRGDRERDLRRPVRARHGARRHRPVPPRPAADAGRRVLRAHHPTPDVPRRAASIDIDGRDSRIRWLDTREGAARCRSTSPPRGRRSSTSAPAPRNGSRSPSAPTPTGSRGASNSPAPRPPTPVAIPADLTFGSYVSIGCHPDIDAARAMVHGSVAAFAHFSSMPGSTGAGLAGRRPGHRRRGRSQLRQQPAPAQRRHAHRRAHGRVHRPVRRHRHARPGRSNDSQELAALGIDRFVVTGPGFGADRDDARTRHQLLVDEVLPALTR